MSETASPPTSDLRFFTDTGGQITVPVEWVPCLIVIPCPEDEWTTVTATVNGRALPVSQRKVEDSPATIVEWPRSGPGWYDISVHSASASWERRIKIAPSKITESSFATMLSDLDERLPVALAIALHDAGARIAIDSIDPQQQTVESEIARLRRAVYGVGGPGLAELLRQIGGDPHRMLLDVREWTKRHRVRRPDASGLIQAVWKAGNLVEGLPTVVLDRRNEHTVDLYENRILKAFVTDVDRRLRMLRPILEVNHPDLAVEVQFLLDTLTRARRAAPFLDDVGSLRSPPSRSTMVLAKRREYRQMYELFLTYRRGQQIRGDDPRVFEPLRNLPSLYQSWGTLIILQAVLKAAMSKDFSVTSQQVVWPTFGGIYVRALRENRAALVMKNDAGDRLAVYPERKYARNSKHLRSISFNQRPDVAVELTSPSGSTDVVLFDPKYKLESEDTEDGDGRPKKVDVDKMHAYRDAIRNTDGQRVVSLAATLYPGATKWYGSDVAALRAYPGEAHGLEAEVTDIIQRWLATHEQIHTTEAVPG